MGSPHVGGCAVRGAARRGGLSFHRCSGGRIAASGFLPWIGCGMDSSQQKVVQYLAEARASEDALVRVLQSQIAMTPDGSYRSVLESHLRETREHAAGVTARLEELGEGANPV